MRDVVTKARAAGTNLAILGANTMYWRVRLEDDGGQPARAAGRLPRLGRRSTRCASSDPAETTARFRDAPDPRPEHALLGMQYECYPVDTAYVVATPGWWGFAGTGVRAGDAIPGLVGPEADRVYPDRRLPRPLQILSQSPYDCRGAATVAHSVYFTPARAGRRSSTPARCAGCARWPIAASGRSGSGRVTSPAGDRQPPPRLRRGPGRSATARPGTTSTPSASRRSTRSPPVDPRVDVGAGRSAIMGRMARARQGSIVATVVVAALLGGCTEPPAGDGPPAGPRVGRRCG